MTANSVLKQYRTLAAPGSPADERLFGAEKQDG